MSLPVVNLFVPCYVDQLYPEVGLATLTVLRRAGCEVRLDPRHTCCGQPMHTAGFAREACSTPYVRSSRPQVAVTATVEPHAFSDVTLAIVTAELAVAENGAVLLSAATLPDRALAWLAEALVIGAHGPRRLAVLPHG